MSWKHSAWASSQITGSPINKLVLMMMADATSHDNPLLVLKIKTLAIKCEASESSIKRAIAELEHRMLIARVSRFFENNQQANGYILVHDGMSHGDLSSIVKSFNTGGCNHILRAFHWAGGIMEGEYDSMIPTPLGSQRTQGGFHVDPPGAQSDLPNNTEFSLPSSSKPIVVGELRAGATKQQPESTLPISDIAPAPRPRKQPRSAKPTIPNVADFLAWATETHPEWVREAEAWYKRMASQDWIKTNGDPILNAKGTFNTWLSKGWIDRIVGSSTGWAKL